MATWNVRNTDRGTSSVSYLSELGIQDCGETDPNTPPLNTLRWIMEQGPAPMDRINLCGACLFVQTLLKSNN